MCEICHQTPCSSRCPNAPEPVPVHTCKKCGYGIFAGDKFWDSPEGPICEECMEDMSYETLLAMMGDEMEEAKEAEYGW